MSLGRMMEKVLKGRLWTFHGGIHPAEHKLESSRSALYEIPLPPLMVLPLKQHVGSSAEVIVKPGQHVLTGQPLTRPESRMQVPIHAPTSGVITAIEMHTVAHPSGLSENCILLQPDGLDTWRERTPLPHYQDLTPLDLVRRIHESGIVGLGGAGFPSDVKLATGREKIELLIINGAECEPYISCDDRLMQEEATRIAEGIEVLRHILKPRLTLIAIEDNKPEAIAAMRAVVDGEQVQVRVIPTKYPSGAARQLIEILTGRQVPAGKRSLTLGVVMFNVGTTFAIRQAVLEDEPLIRRVVTLTGEQFRKPGNAWVRLGTSVRWLLAQGGLQPEPRQRIIMGGPMMGFTLPHADVPVVKITNCLMAPSQHELPQRPDEMSCIRCSQCADACPVSLLPQQLYWYSKAGEHDQARKYDIDECIECGACAWVCPSNIPLVQYYREEKAELQRLDLEAEQAERAKQRFEAKKLRMETERQAREARHAQAGQARRAAMTEANGGEDPVAAALARVKARQAEQAQQAETPLSGSSQEPASPDTLRAQREARKQQAIARQQAATSEPVASSDDAAPVADLRQAAVAAALARAKARKAAQAAEPTAEHSADDQLTTAPTDNAPTSAPAADPRQAAVAAAVARAKARKAAQAAEPAAEHIAGDQLTSAPTDSTPASAPAADPRQAAVAAAVARAKARKAAQAATQQAATAASSSSAPSSSEE